MLTVDYDRLGVRAGDRVLDLGCGAGRHAFEAQRRGADVVALDTNGSELAGVQATFAAVGQAGSCERTGADGRRVALAAPVIGDAGRLPFCDGSFDHVIAAEVLEHIPDDARVLAEIGRVLRPGGRVAVTVPRFWPEVVCWGLSRKYHRVEGGHVRIYRRSQLRRRTAAAGLAWVETHHAHALHSPYWWLKCVVGVDRSPWAVRAYHRLLVWDIMRRPAVTRVSERLLNPVLGKSLVAYLTRSEMAGSNP